MGAGGLQFGGFTGAQLLHLLVPSALTFCGNSDELQTPAPIYPRLTGRGGFIELWRQPLTLVRVKKRATHALRLTHGSDGRWRFRGSYTARRFGGIFRRGPWLVAHTRVAVML